MTRLIVVAALIVFGIYLALPGFWLKKAVGRETLDATAERLGQPLLSAPKPGTIGTIVNTYRVGIQPPLCVDYIITFVQKESDEPGVKPIITDWDWKTCGLP